MTEGGKEIIIQYIKMTNKNSGMCNFCIEKVDITQVFVAFFSDL